MVEKTILVRRIRASEGVLFRQIRLNALRESPWAFASTYESSLQRNPANWEEQAKRTAQGSDRATFIAFCGDSAIGIAALYRLGETSTGELVQVWVSPEWRGQGVARALLDAALGWAEANGFAKVIASVERKNAKVVGFYEKCGFRREQEESAATPYSSIVLWKKVESST